MQQKNIKKRMITVGFENLVNALDSPFTSNGKAVIVARKDWENLKQDYNNYLKNKMMSGKKYPKGKN